MFQWEFVDVQNERRVLCSLETQVLITKHKQQFLNYQSVNFFSGFPYTGKKTQKQTNRKLKNDGQIK